MATYRPGDIYTGAFGMVGADGVLTASPVGASAQWADDLDATYCDIYAQNTAVLTGVSTTLAAADFASIAGTPTSVTVRCRLERLVDEVVGEQKFGILFPTSEGNASAYRTSIASGAPVTNGLTTGVPDWVSFDVTESAAATRLADGLTIMFGTRFATAGTTDPVAMFRVYEVALDVVSAGYHPLRRFPRSDGLGIGPRRHYPLPSSGQRSLRRVGGTY